MEPPDSASGREEARVPDYSQIDQSPLPGFLFFPRKFSTKCPPGAFDFPVPVDEGVSIACRFYAGDEAWPWILYFHGNGEVASDYDEIAPLYHRKKMNLVLTDYRGYGASGGSPTFTHLIQDSHSLFTAIGQEISRKGWRGNLWVMGRSLGSLSALELAFHHPDQMKGLVIESGFASVTRLIKHLGLPARGIDLETLEQKRLSEIQKISVPALLIHGEMDTLVPLQEARDLLAALGSAKKKLVIIPGADHNNLMFLDLELYLSEIRSWIDATP